jgi:hypothetical protein
VETLVIIQLLNMIKTVKIRYSVEYETDAEIIVPDTIAPNFTTNGRPMVYNMIMNANRGNFDIIAPENNSNTIIDDSLKIIEIWD